MKVWLLVLGFLVVLYCQDAPNDADSSQSADDSLTDSPKISGYCVETSDGPVCNCINDPYSASQTIGASCTCQDNFSWNPDNGRCERDCSTDSTGAADPQNPSNCVCESSYTWNNQTNSCDQQPPGIFIDEYNSKHLDVGFGVGLGVGLPLFFIAVITIECCCARCDRKRKENQFRNQVNAAYANYRAGTATSLASLNPSAGEVCSICMMRNTGCRSTCGHSFHRACIQMWMTRSPACPTCRRSPLQIM